MAQAARLEIDRAWPSWRSELRRGRSARGFLTAFLHRERAATLRRPVGTSGTSLETIEKHYGDARVDAEQLDEMNLSGTLPDARDDSLPSKVKEPFVFYGVPRRAGDRGRTGDVQLGKLIEEGPEDYDPWA